MSSTDPPTKSWWSLSKSSSTKEVRQNRIDVKADRRSSNAAKHSSGLKSIAVAIGFKSRRPSKEPVCPADGSQASDTSSGPKSPSTLSPIDSLEPFDTRLRRPRQSLLTLADDPFAGHPPVVSIHQSPLPGRFSVYSSPSITDLTSSKTDSPVYRSSYASSSTNSNSLGPDLISTTMSNSHLTFPESKKLHLKRSIGSMQVKLSDDLSQYTSLIPSISRRSPSVPVSDEALRPKLRSRGMTVGGLPQKSGFFVKEQTTKRKLSQASTSNSIAASVKHPEPPRQTSSSRVFAPPTAPPSVGLPAPPQTIQVQPDFHHRKGMNSLPPFSSSSLPSLVNDHITSLSPIHDDSQTSKQNIPGDDCSISGSIEVSSRTATSTPRTLKKLPSQRSLRPASSPSSSMSSKTTTIDSSEKRKQRNSQQCRLPMPTLSLSIRTSFVSTPPRNGDDTSSSPYSITDQRKSRKRLFSSGSQKPSLLPRIPTHREDDTSSVSSLRSDQDTIHPTYKPWVVTRNYPKTFWDESLDTTPTSPAPKVDYQPQAIMSRDELAKLEASVSNANAEQEALLGSFPPPNGLEEPSGVLSHPPSIKPEPSSGWSNDATHATSTSRSRSARRPVTADPLGRDSSREAMLGSGESRRLIANVAVSRLDMLPESTSLPPPPRRRLLSSNSVRSTASTSTTSTLVPSPVERLNFSKMKLLDRPNTAVTTTSPLQPSALGTRSLPIATSTIPRPIATSRGKVRTSGVLEKAIHRRSIMRKPSFLEIDAETDPESEPEVAEKRDSLFLNMKPPSATTIANGSSKTGESFLDLARESFDTIRS